MPPRPSDPKKFEVLDRMIEWKIAKLKWLKTFLKIHFIWKNTISGCASTSSSKAVIIPQNFKSKLSDNTEKVLLEKQPWLYNSKIVSGSIETK
jgi:hypothetical protein